ncbi:hypothetical protein CspeluHIS016_0208910 [Cutaneotrichosporon spelunceum]|uniref:Uncharacterized protein n=1 Tax=Cutaneotrichosporon spelunceum TaxID=1672016 RepID=A0AAD3YAB1_9TREE|nr:hypothetical protein CspeluHIS016_0208910 [Cutaneotrichosporon spelunceum]
MDPSPQFLLLAATLLDSALDNDTVLLQLHSVFGPMLMSALRLVDRREVVHIDLGGRGMHQVSSSSGAPYTLYLNLPDLPPKPPKESSEEPKEGSGDVEEAGEDAALARQAAESEAVRKAKADNNARLRINAERLRHIASMYSRCYSPIGWGGWWRHG